MTLANSNSSVKLTNQLQRIKNVQKGVNMTMNPMNLGSGTYCLDLNLAMLLGNCIILGKFLCLIFYICKIYN